MAKHKVRNIPPKISKASSAEPIGRMSEVSIPWTMANVIENLGAFASPRAWSRGREQPGIVTNNTQKKSILLICIRSDTRTTPSADLFNPEPEWNTTSPQKKIPPANREDLCNQYDLKAVESPTRG